MAGAASDPVLDRRRLNRAYLERQLLLRRHRMTALEAVEHLVGLQAQNPNPPYPALFSRLTDFRFAELAELMLQRRAARATLMRGTVHLASARDVAALRPLLQPHLVKVLDGSPHGRAVPDAWRPELLAYGRELLARDARTPAGLRAALAGRWPDRDADALAHVLRFALPTVQVTPRGVWGRSGRTAHALLDSWFGPTSEPPLSREELLRRYLAAFGPATAADVTTWSGMTGWRPFVEGLRPQLACFRDESGRELFDLPDAPRPPADTPAPVRLVAEFDNLTLSHADRTRVVAAADRPRLMTRNGIIPGTLLVDGFVAGTWRWQLAPRTATLTVRPWSRLTRADRAAAGAEAHALLTAAAPDAAHTVTVAPPE